MLSQIFQLGSALFLVMLLVLLHELGHYLAAKALGIPVQRFSIGIGPPLLSRTWKEEIWQIGWFPFGGFVQIDSIYPLSEDEDRDETERLPSVSMWKRVIVILSGPIMNFSLSLLFFSILWGAGGVPKVFRDVNPFIGELHPQSDLRRLGLRSGDRILSYEGDPVLLSHDHFSKRGAVSGLEVEALSIGYRGRPTQTIKGTIRSLALRKAVDTYGVIAPGSFILYQAPVDSNVPLVSSGLRKGDRVLWANGRLTFCFESFEGILSGESILCTVQDRLGRVQQKVIERIPLLELMDSAQRVYRLGDLVFDSRRPSLRPEWWIPYLLSSDLVVTDQLLKLEMEGLEVGDKILSLQGVPVSSLSECVRALQTRKMFLIVEREPYPNQLKQAIKSFEAPFHDSRLYQLIEEGIPGADKGPFFFLQPVEMRAREDLVPDQMQGYRNLLRQFSFGSLQNDIYADLVAAKGKQPILGGFFSDHMVQWRPSPFFLFTREMQQNFKFLANLFIRWNRPKLIGPIGIVRHLYGEVKAGPTQLLYLVGALSLQLGFFNLLPIPVLDGGHLMFLAWEAILGRPLPPRIMKKLLLIFFAFFW
ncbi:site-2 protease family protein, partial [Candidatus Similichlamydia laticola]